MRRWIDTAVGGLLGVTILFAGACSGGGSNSNGNADTWEPPQRDTSDPPEATWETEFIEKDGWGRDVDIEVGSDGAPTVAYFATDETADGKCSDIMGEPARQRWPLHVGQRDSGSWTIETVAKPIYTKGTKGLDLEFDPNGAMTIAARTGEPAVMLDFCGANNAALFRKGSDGTWSEESVVTSSSAVAVEKSGADFGEVVGVWPALAYGEDGTTALVYKDVHAGGRQRDDFKIAALEIAVDTGGGWNVHSVDPYSGAGDRSDVVFGDQGQIFVSYVMRAESNTEDQLGVWVARSKDDGNSWDKVHLFNHGTSSRPALAVDPDSGNLHVLYYNSKRGFPELAVLDDPAKFEKPEKGWTFREDKVGDARFDSGVSPSLAFGPDGLLHAVFYRCGVASSGLGNCTADEDAVVHAWRDGEIWNNEVVDAGGGDLCGMKPSLAFDGNGRPVVAYRCNLVVGDTNKIKRGVKFGIKKK